MATEILIQETITEVSVTDPNNILIEVDGTQGPVGASNSLAIGTVTTVQPSSSASATITGSSPNQTLNLGIPQGLAATVTVGTTTTSNPGTNATIVNAGTSSAAILNFTVPRGNPGDLTQALADERYVKLTGSTMTGKLILDGNPSSALHAAPKQYVDNLSAGINFHAAVRLATTANLTSTYSNGTSGVGATLTATVNDTLTIDGFVAALNDRVLVKNQTSALQNGIYVVSNAGSGAAPWVLTRATDADNSPAGELATGDFCFTETGTANGGSGFILNTAGTITIGTTAVNYTQFNTAQAIAAGIGLTESPVNTLNVTVPVVSPTGQSGKFLSTDGTYTSWTNAITNAIVRGTEEDVNIVVAAATGTINLNVDDASILYYTTNATANHTLNIRYSSSVSLSTALATGDAITVVWINTNGATAYRPTVIQVDGTTITPLWQGGTAPTTGNASSTDVYSFTVIKTAATPTYVVLGSQTQFKA